MSYWSGEKDVQSFTFSMEKGGPEGTWAGLVRPCCRHTEYIPFRWRGGLVNWTDKGGGIGVDLDFC